MPIVILLGLLLLLALVFGPGLWAKYTLAKHRGDRPDIPGTGGELARHLLDLAGLPDVAVERVPRGDHYDPVKKAVRLEPHHHDGRSLTAVAVAAHEVGHALQDRDGYRPLKARTELVRSTAALQRAGAMIIMASPFLALLSRSPWMGLVTVIAGVLTIGSQVVVHLVTLPVEFDASFARALPMLKRGRYLDRQDLPAARRILRACALTYVAGALTSLLNLAQWIRFLR
jgi:Zn-dependent membrane protease YugP